MSDKREVVQEGIKIVARAPVDQNGFVEFQGTGKQLDHIQALYNSVSDVPIDWGKIGQKKGIHPQGFEKLTSFTGEEVLWNEHEHKCTDLDGNLLQGGSTYAAQFEKPFEADIAAASVVKSKGFTAPVWIEHWDQLGNLSAQYGTTVHLAVEFYIKNKHLGDENALPRIPHLRKAVLRLLEKTDFDKCISEPLITDTAMGMSGWIDLLRKTGPNTYAIEDFKTNTFKTDNDYDKKFKGKLKTYQNQLNYYGQILENAGHKISGIVIWHWHKGQWDKHEMKYKGVPEYARESN